MFGETRGQLINEYREDYVLFDLETTGISCNYDEVIEIAAVKVIGGKVVDEFSEFVNPGRSIPKGATAVNHITNAMVAKADPFDRVLGRFLRFVGDLPLVGHNIHSFDMKFLYRDCEKYFAETLSNSYIDTLKIAKKCYPEMRHHRLSDMAELFGIPTDGAHRALCDCRMNQQVFERMADKLGRDQAKNTCEGTLPQKPYLDRLRCVVERITYQNEETGYTVLKCAAKKEHDLVTVVGTMPEMFVGTVLLLEGRWKMDARYGRQFAVEQYEEALPATVYGIEKYLGSGLIKGVGPKYAKKIVETFGEQTLEVLEENPDSLIKVSGIGKIRVERIKTSWAQQREIKNIMLFLQSHEVSTSHATKIFKQYGGDSIQIVQGNPYRLADDIWGIGFKTADTIAEKLGFDKTRFVRLRSGIFYTLNKLAESGHCYAEREQLIEKAIELLEVEEPELQMTLDEMIRTEDVILDKEAVYLPPFYHSEAGCARRLLTLMCEERKVEINEDAILRRIQSSEGITYDEIQLEAIRTAIDSKVMILTGGPGTGKTTTTVGIISAYRAAGCRILLAAPTGRAAKRMTEATGMEAKTIHRLLEFKPPGGYQKNEENPLDADVLIVDECSMIDILLMYNLLKALPEHMTLILVGDIDQLPSVGAGNVLRDMIASEQIPVVRLTRVFRQAQGSRIIMNAHRINHGERIDMRGGKDSDFFFAAKETNEEVVDLLIQYCTKNLPRYYKVDAMRDIQVLTPMQRGVCGAVNLNQKLQEAMNPGQSYLRRGGTEYRLHDKVMQIRNNYDKEVFNGDIGWITKVDLDERELVVTFDGRDILYDVTELDELVLAYATTIHKAQGSEYPIVVMPFTMSHYVMLQRNLLYTGVTRAKKILVLIGEKRAVYYAIGNETTTTRNTKLAQRLIGG